MSNCGDRAGPRHLEPEGLARVRGGEVEIVDDHPDVVEAAEHDARSYTGMTLAPMLVADLGDGRSLRQLDDADAEELFELIDANRAHLASWMPFVGQTRAPADSLAFIRAARRQAEENRGVQLAIIHDGQDHRRRRLPRHRLVAALDQHRLLARRRAAGRRDDDGDGLRDARPRLRAVGPRARRDPRRRRQPPQPRDPRAARLHAGGRAARRGAHRHARDRPRRLRDDGARLGSAAPPRVTTVTRARASAR